MSDQLSSSRVFVFVMALFFINFLEMGVLKSFSVLVDDLVIQLNTNLGTIGLIVGIYHGFTYALGMSSLQSMIFIYQCIDKEAHNAYNCLIGCLPLNQIIVELYIQKGATNMGLFKIVLLFQKVPCSLSCNPNGGQLSFSFSLKVYYCLLFILSNL